MTRLYSNNLGPSKPPTSIESQVSMTVPFTLIVSFYQEALRSKVFMMLLLASTLIISTLVSPSLTYAIQSDSYAPIEVQADEAKLSELTQTATYSGNVKLKQGTLEIMCETLTIFNSPEGVERIEAVGEPATYTQLIEETKPTLDASANKITYLPASKRIRLEGLAKILQGGNTFEGQRIEYDLQSQVLVASSDTDENKKTESQRVKMTLQPNTSKQPSTSKQ